MHISGLLCDETYNSHTNHTAEGSTGLSQFLMKGKWVLNCPDLGHGWKVILQQVQQITTLQEGMIYIFLMNNKKLVLNYVLMCARGSRIYICCY